MVGRLALIVALLLAPTTSPADLTGTATAVAAPLTVTPTVAGLEPHVAGLEPYKPETNKPVEDFFVVSIISLPFTALWSIVGAAVIGGIAQKQFPPNFSNQALMGTATFALASSVSIGLLSVTWGKGKSDSSKPTANP